MVNQDAKAQECEDCFRIFAISDLHVDYAANMAWVQNISDSDYQNDVLLIAGDISSNISQVRQVLKCLASKFRFVSFVPGNHDCWIFPNSPYSDSFDKIEHIHEICAQFGVMTTPFSVGDVFIVPLYSWYDDSLASVDDCLTRAQRDQMNESWMDFQLCKWPLGSNPSHHFHAFNEKSRLTPPAGSKVISFSHFLPRRDLMGPQRVLRAAFLPWVVGSTRLEEQVRRLGSHIHIVGHTHRPFDRTIDGVRYIQQPLGYPRERYLCKHELQLVHARAEPSPARSSPRVIPVLPPSASAVPSAAKLPVPLPSCLACSLPVTSTQERSPKATHPTLGARDTLLGTSLPPRLDALGLFAAPWAAGD
eukprot:gnl/Trimastix_PCT/785.p1 GENE.gnl/Trimastix_PCT/785~~gnl/Trimastix_PCT/785.p1  ORF type:complete len:362 (-),score=26.70 gnl/Trimastix_PCT/785:72-1157(-)